MPDQPRLIADETAEPVLSVEEKTEYLERLRKKLQDSEFRQIEGFPIGSNEAILELSNPPYYTACPNPFLPEVIDRWQKEREQIREELRLPNNGGYQREPFAADVSEGKSGSIYNAHTYHTKVPHRAIMRYILHYTEPGDLIFDGFAGTGMTGVAAQLLGSPEEISELGYHVDEEGVIYSVRKTQSSSFSGRNAISRVGVRRVILNDLAPVATFIAANYNLPTDTTAFKEEADCILREVVDEYGWMYETHHPHVDAPEAVRAPVNFTVWSEVLVCPECNGEMLFWNVAVDKETGYRKKKSEPLECPSCGAEAVLSDLERAWVTFYDERLDLVVRSLKRVPVLINYQVNGKKYEKEPDQGDLTLLDRIQRQELPQEVPSVRMPEGDESRRNDDIGLTHVHHFYTKRNLLVAAALAKKVRQAPADLRDRLRFWLQTVWLGQTLLNRYLSASYSQVNRYLKGTLYVGPFISEVSPWYAFTNKINAASKLDFAVHDAAAITTGSAEKIIAPDNSVDYIFTDPPFGANINYSDLNFIWESWLGVTTNNRQEAVVSRAHRKSLSDYQDIMSACFAEYYRLLKPGRWMTVEFHNSKNSVWNAIQEALMRAGFVVADVRTLDKQQMTMQQMTSMGAVKQDLVISAYKPGRTLEQAFITEAGTTAGAWEFVREHLAKLPIVVSQKGVIETLSERQDYLLFDRMVAFHIQRGATVPISAAEFYRGLRERFVERDGMFFLPEQVLEYDRARLEAQEVAQLSLFVDDEKSTIQWLRHELSPEYGGEPQTYQEIQPKFLKQLHQARHEELPELGEILEQNFLQDEQERWYVPDPSKASDLEKLRQKALLREFETYTKGKKRLKQFRTEAVRAGFAQAWQDRDYQTIVAVAERLPEDVLQEAPDLLMYYDNASLRV